MPKEQYMCQLCANHGIFNQPKKGHKQKCAYKTCSCDMCALNTKRRTLDQIERQLRAVIQPPSVNNNIQDSSADKRAANHQLASRSCPYTRPSSIFTSVKFLIENA